MKPEESWRYHRNGSGAGDPDSSWCERFHILEVTSGRWENGEGTESSRWIQDTVSSASISLPQIPFASSEGRKLKHPHWFIGFHFSITKLFPSSENSTFILTREREKERERTVYTMDNSRWASLGDYRGPLGPTHLQNKVSMGLARWPSPVENRAPIFQKEIGKFSQVPLSTLSNIGPFLTNLKSNKLLFHIIMFYINSTLTLKFKILNILTIHFWYI